MELRLGRILVCGSSPSRLPVSKCSIKALSSISLHLRLKSRDSITLRLRVYRLLSRIPRMSVLLSLSVVRCRISSSSKTCISSRISTDRVSPCASSLAVVHFCIIYNRLLWWWRRRIVYPFLRCHSLVSVLTVMICCACCKF